MVIISVCIYVVKKNKIPVGKWRDNWMHFAIGHGKIPIFKEKLPQISHIHNNGHFSSTAVIY